MGLSEADTRAKLIDPAIYEGTEDFKEGINLIV